MRKQIESKNRECFVCLHYDRDPDDPIGDETWFTCKSCGAIAHEMCGKAVKRYGCRILSFKEVQVTILVWVNAFEALLFDNLLLACSKP